MIFVLLMLIAVFWYYSINKLKRAHFSRLISEGVEPSENLDLGLLNRSEWIKFVAILTTALLLLIFTVNL